jgi:hypothetical protein
MFDSNVAPYPGRTLDPTNERRVAAWINSLPPAEPNTRDIGAFLMRVGGEMLSFRVTRAAIEKLAGSSEGSTSMLAAGNFDQIERQCAALHARTAVQPSAGWILDAADLI